LIVGAQGLRLNRFILIIISIFESISSSLRDKYLLSFKIFTLITFPIILWDFETMQTQNQYRELLQQFPPRPLKNDQELEKMQERVNSLLDQPELTPDEQDYLDLLGTLIYEYEQTQDPIPDIYGVEFLKVWLS
jgi:DNA mismatch repair ATPase MutS